MTPARHARNTSGAPRTVRVAPARQDDPPSRSLCCGRTRREDDGVERVEHRVPRSLGEDRRRGYHGDIAVTLYDRARAAHELVGTAVAVDPGLAGRDRQRLDRSAHRQERRGEDVERVDLGDFGRRDRPCKSVPPDLDREPLARRRCEKLRIAQAADRMRGIENHRGGDDRAGERPSTGFVDARDEDRRRVDQHTMPAARNSTATASAASLPVSVASEAPNPANSASRRRRVTVSS